jgi:hypothetical protein
MAGVASQASFFGDSLVRHTEVHGHVMTLAAQGIAVMCEEGLVVRGVRPVAGAAVAFLKRRVNGSAFTCIDSCVMAPFAQAGVGIRYLKGFGGIGRTVAFVARNVYRNVGTRSQQYGLPGGMRTVAGGAVPVLDLVSTVGLPERPVGFVALQTEAVGLTGEKVLLVRTVRFMAGPAAVLLHHLVTDLPFEALPVVALETDLPFDVAEKVIVVRGMGIVARCTSA